MDLRTIHLFAGSGGGIWADLILGHTPVCAVEVDPYCQRVLVQRQRDGDFPPFPIWDDVRTFGRTMWTAPVDVVHAGFPCQPWSVTGNRRGEADDRNLWPDTLRVVGELRPRYVFLENVAALIATAYFRDTILRQLTEARYDAGWCTLSARDVGANHIRKRLWLLAADTMCFRCNGHTEDTRSFAPGENERGKQQSKRGSTYLATARSWLPRKPTEWQGREGTGRGSQEVSDTNRAGLSQRQSFDNDDAAQCSSAERNGWWQFEPGLGRVADGVAHRRNRIRALGNGQVPLCAAVAWCLLWSRLMK